MYPVYYPHAGDTLPIHFPTFGSDNESITITGLAVTDIEIYKDGGTTQRASDNGYTLLDTDGIDFDGITGIHGFSIDLSDNSDSGFYTAGAWYTVVVSAITVNGQTVSFVAAAFRIEPVPGAAGGPPTVDANNRIVGIQGTLNTLDALDTAQDSQHGTTQSSLSSLITTVGAAGAGLTEAGGTGDHLTALATAAGLAALNDLDASEIRTAIGLGSANLDTQLGDIPTVAEFNARTIVAASYGTAANQSTIITHLTDVKGATFNGATDSLEALRDRGDSAWITGSGGDATEAKQDTIIARIGVPANTGGGATLADNLADRLDVPVSTRAEAVSAGSGAFVVTVTVDDGTDPLEGVTVRLREGANNFTAVTNASGVATFSLDAATYTISMTKVGYQFTPTTIVVTTAADFPQSMTAITVSASAPGFSTGVLTCYDEDGAVESGVVVSIQIKTGPGTAGLAYDNTVRTETSGGDGVVQFTGMVIGARYEIWRSNRAGRIDMLVPDAASFNINEIIGSP